MSNDNKKGRDFWSRPSRLLDSFQLEFLPFVNPISLSHSVPSALYVFDPPIRSIPAPYRPSDFQVRSHFRLPLGDRH
jgi:hypothetical protein